MSLSSISGQPSVHGTRTASARAMPRTCGRRWQGRRDSSR
jgi:hypothetical protein